MTVTAPRLYAGAPPPFGPPTLVATAGSNGAQLTELNLANNAVGVSCRLSNTVWAVCVHTDGTIYFADSGNFVIRKISPTGIVSTLCGSGATGNADGTGTAAIIGVVKGLALTAAGDILYFSDNTNQRIKKVVTATGVVTTMAGNNTGSDTDNATGTTGTIQNPGGIFLDPAETFVYSLSTTTTKLRKIGTSGLFPISTITLSGAAPLASGPICRDSTQTNLWAPANNGTFVKIVFATGVGTQMTANAAGAVDGIIPASSAALNAATGVCMSPDDLYVYWADTVNNKIRVYEIATAALGTLSGGGGTGTATAGDAEGFVTTALYGSSAMHAICCDSMGNLLVHNGNSRLAKIDASTGYMNYLAGDGSNGFQNGFALGNVPTGINVWAIPTGSTLPSAIAKGIARRWLVNPGVTEDRALAMNLTAGDLVYAQAVRFGAHLTASGLQL